MPGMLTAVARLEEGMRFDAEAGSGHHVLLDSGESGGGKNEGFRPMEMLLVGLAGCTGMDVLSILRKKRQRVTAFEVRVQGVRAETHPMVFEDITIEYIITGYDVQPEAVERSIELSMTRYCGASATLGKTARIKHKYCIIEAE
ncbi:MAG TPA: OsmC family protein [Ktedonobacteraceae bacterium]|nr:OsmC family protein [Ktedonobacteraceae bacterium]